MPDYYGTTAGADEYHATRGNEAWGNEGVTFRKTSALLRASQYIDTHYTFTGAAAAVDQIREWPRSGVSYRGETFPSDTTPTAVEYAAYEAALRELEAPGSLAPDYTEAGAIRSQKKAVGPLSTETEYTTATSAAQLRPVISVIDGLLRPFLKAGRGNINFPVFRG